MATKTDTERADFEAFMSDNGKFPQAIERDTNGNYILMQAASSWDVWQARAALQSQDREDAERLQYLLRRVCMYQTASYGCKFEILNLPPHFGDCEPDPIPPFLAAIDHARRIEDKP